MQARCGWWSEHSSRTRCKLVLIVADFSTLIRRITDRSIVCHLLRAARYTDVVIMAYRVTGQKFEPVSITGLKELQTGLEISLADHIVVHHSHKTLIGIHLRKWLRLIACACFICFLAELNALERVHIIEHAVVGPLTDRQVAGIAHRRTVCRTLLGRDHNYTVRCLRAVDRCGRRILENCNCLNILRIEP